ncbi:ribonuclease H family protein [Flagellimonas marinaquae]
MCTSNFFLSLKINARKSFFVCEGLEYLGYWKSCVGIQPLPKKVDAIMRLSYPKTRKESCSFIGLVNYYPAAWIQCSDILAPLAELAGANSKWEWTDVHQNAFDTMKTVVAQEILLAFPDFNKPFDIYNDASKLQLGAAITQGKKPIGFYSCKLNLAQRNYTTTERELLAIVETL